MANWNSHPASTFVALELSLKGDRESALFSHVSGVPILNYPVYLILIAHIIGVGFFTLFNFSWSEVYSQLLTFKEMKL